MRFNLNETFILADSHHGHANILKYVNRPFENVDEMDQALINRWNERVGPDNIVFHLGDFTLGGRERARKYFSQLNGNIHLLANHFHHDKRWLDGIQFGRTDIYRSANGNPVTLLPPIHVLYLEQVLIGGAYPLPVTLCHYPMAEWEASFHGSVHLHGHSHGRHTGGGRILDVGVDNHNYYPISLLEVLNHFGFIV